MKTTLRQYANGVYEVRGYGTKAYDRRSEQLQRFSELWRAQLWIEEFLKTPDRKVDVFYISRISRFGKVKREIRPNLCRRS